MDNQISINSRFSQLAFTQFFLKIYNHVSSNSRFSLSMLTLLRFCFKMDNNVSIILRPTCDLALTRSLLPCIFCIHFFDKWSGQYQKQIHSSSAHLSALFKINTQVNVKHKFSHSATAFTYYSFWNKLSGHYQTERFSHLEPTIVCLFVKNHNQVRNKIESSQCLPLNPAGR